MNSPIPTILLQQLWWVLAQLPWLQPGQERNLLEYRKVIFKADENPLSPGDQTELFDWAHQQIADSQTDHLLDKAAITRMLNDHREGRSDHSRRLWTVLIFMVWHGIFVEKRIVPAIAEPTYPVRL